MFLPHPVRGVLSLLFLSLNTLVCGSVLLLFSLVKLLIPLSAVRRSVDPVLHAIVDVWAIANAAWMTLVQKTRWDVRGALALRRDRWYLVVANHQSWADIFVMQKVLVRRMPMLKFVLKQQLIWVPVIGLAWWALDFPFMKRHSPEYLAAHPERRGDDLRAIRRACEKFALVPSAMMNYLEGTRFTEAKRAASSPYRHLLRAKTGGFALALDAMGPKFQSLLDITLFYPGKTPTFFEFLSGRMKEVVVIIEERPIPPELAGGDSSNDPELRSRINAWVAELWKEKDDKLEELHASYVIESPSS